MILSVLFNLLKGRVFSYVFFRYVGYAIQFLNSLIIAKYLGPFYFGLYGFTTLIIQYANYSNFGIPYSLNVSLSRNLDNIGVKDRNTFGASISSLFLISLFIVFLAIFLNNTSIPLFLKYNFYNYIFIVMLIVISELWCQLFINLYRTFNKLRHISLYQVLPHILILIYCIIYEDKNFLLQGILLSQTLGLVISLLVFIINKPLKPLWGFDRNDIFNLFIKGISLLVYNFVFNLILISSRTMIGIFYSVEDMGIYSLINSMSNAIGMLIGSISFVFFPKMIYKLKDSVPLKDAEVFINRINYWYFFGTSFLVYLIIGLIPLISLILPEYKMSIIPFSYLLLTQLILAYLFGHAVFLIARNKERVLTSFAFIAILINVFVIYILNKMDFSFIYVPFVTLFAMAIYVISVRYYSSSLLKQQKVNVKGVFDMIPLKKMLLPLLLICFLNFFKNGYVYYFLGFISFLLLGFKDIREGRREFINIVRTNFF